MTFLPRLFLFLCLYNPVLFATTSTETPDDPYEIYKAQSFIPLKEVPRYERGTFHPKGATIFDIETTYLAFPRTTVTTDLFKHLLRNDVMLMLYLSRNKGMSEADKMAVRLEAFNIVHEFFRELRSEEDDEELPRMAPLFKFSGGNIMRLHMLMWLPLQGARKALSSNGISFNLRGSLVYCEEETSTGESIKYTRFLSHKERRILEGADPELPRSQQRAGKGKPAREPRSFRHRKRGLKADDYQ